jgi:hypothetical protein
MDKTIALIGDIVASRRISKRTIFDEMLLDTLNRLNRQNPNILSPYTLIGDEIQAVFSSADFLFHDTISILATIHPEKMRFSFGVGTLVTPINPEQAIEMDGPAFHNARDGVEELKKVGYLFNIVGEDIPNLNLLRQTLFLLSHNMDRWKRTRLQALAMLQKDLSVKEIAAKLHISDKAVYKTIDVGALDIVIALFGEVQDALNASIGERGW